MAFSKKTWKDRVSQYINRRLLTDSDGNTQQVTVTRDEGSVTEAGDAFSAANMNDLEDRIEDAFDGLTAADIPYSQGVSVADKLDSLTTVKDVSSSVTKYTNIDYFEKSVVRSGNVVCVYISFSFSSTPTANNIIAENLPKASSNMLLLCECSSGSNNGKASRVMVNTFGRVLDWYTSGFFGTGMNYSIIGSYITNDPI